jgi:hypothetical protein
MGKFGNNIKNCTNGARKSGKIGDIKNVTNGPRKCGKIGDIKNGTNGSCKIGKSLILLLLLLLKCHKWRLENGKIVDIIKNSTNDTRKSVKIGGFITNGTSGARKSGKRGDFIIMALLVLERRKNRCY